jgi:aromatic ring-opening dioxygenase catalytic subunit (LigB family)
MDDPQGHWKAMELFLRALPGALLEQPRAILVISGHWETQGFELTASPAPPLLFDYYGFPPHTYQLRYDVPGSPSLATKAASLLQAAGFTARLDQQRGLDHGVFVPLKVIYPEATIPVVELSLDRSLDPALHLAAGQALASLRDEGVLILSAGMSFHNLRALGDPRATEPSVQFDQWLTQAVGLKHSHRNEQLQQWSKAPAARIAHPRAEHLLPMMVAAGASSGPGTRVFSEHVMGAQISGYRFD